MKISVALAAYKGEQYIAEQVQSILNELGENDELIISDDFPEGKTFGEIEELIAKDKRIKYVEGPRKGVVRNFESALQACSGDIIFLSDQDDVWLEGKVDAVIKEFENGADLVLHDASVADSVLGIIQPSFFAVHGSNASFAKNILKNSFVGCCMAFTREVMLESLPFPKKLPMHDWWIALRAMQKKRKIVLLDQPLILWRRHGDNVTGGKTTVADKIIWRIRILSALLFPICAFGKEK